LSAFAVNSQGSRALVSSHCPVWLEPSTEFGFQLPLTASTGHCITPPGLMRSAGCGLMSLWPAACSAGCTVPLFAAPHPAASSPATTSAVSSLRFTDPFCGTEKPADGSGLHSGFLCRHRQFVHGVTPKWTIRA
jgi:hypothetical protein